ncbi:MAG: extracellular solute-binding protein [Syntrophothermus sp.]
MKFEKLIYVVLSTILITTLILVSYISFPMNFSGRGSSGVKRIYYVDHISRGHKTVIDNFNRKYAGQIEVVPINLPFEKFSTNERKELLARFLRSRSDRIDVFAVDQIWVPRFAKWGIPLEKHITPIQKENLLSYATQSCVYQKQLIALPAYIDISTLFYRKDLLKRLPDYQAVKAELDSSITWEEFIKLGMRMKMAANPYFTFQANDFEGLMCIFTELVSSQNGELIKGDSLRINTPETRKALRLLVDLVNKYEISPKEVVKFKENPSYNYFINRDGIFLRGWASFLNAERTAGSLNRIYGDIEKAPMPHFAGGKSVGVYGGWNLMVSCFSTKVQESVIFMNYIMSEESQKILYDQSGCLPVNNGVYRDTLFIKKHPELAFFRTLLGKGVHRPFSERYTVISDILSYFLNQAVRNKMTVEEALAGAEEKINSQSILLK